VSHNGESPPDKEESGLRDRDPTRNSSTTTKSDYATNDSFALWLEVTALIGSGWSAYGELMRQSGWAERNWLCDAGECQTANRYQGLLGIAKSGLDLPTQAALAKARTLSHDPCRTRCKKCSQCFHSMSYWARGGRDWLGVAAEAELARGAS
jgi:hypothetical protein